MTIPVHEGCSDYLDIIEDEKDKKSDKKNDSSTKSSMIITLIKENPSISIPKMATSLEMSVAGVRKIIDKLKAQGTIQRVGPDKGGYWQVL